MCLTINAPKRRVEPAVLRGLDVYTEKKKKTNTLPDFYILRITKVPSLSRNRRSRTPIALLYARQDACRRRETGRKNRQRDGGERRLFLVNVDAMVNPEQARCRKPYRSSWPWSGRACRHHWHELPAAGKCLGYLGLLGHAGVGSHGLDPRTWEALQYEGISRSFRHKSRNGKP